MHGCGDGEMLKRGSRYEPRLERRGGNRGRRQSPERRCLREDSHITRSLRQCLMERMPGCGVELFQRSLFEMKLGRCKERDMSERYATDMRWSWRQDNPILTVKKL